MRLVLFSLLILSFSAYGTEVKSLGPENISLNRRLIKLLGPNDKQDQLPQSDEKENKVINLKGTESHVSQR